MENREIEVKFLEIDKAVLIERLLDLGSQDLGEELITEQIFYDKEKKWISEHKFIRIRTTGKGIFLTYKHKEDRTATGTLEIEFQINEPGKASAFLTALDLVMFRTQEKKRHKFKLGDITVDIDTWPKIPTYVELEGPTEEAIMDASKKLGFDWSKGVFGTAAYIIEEVYNIPVRQLRYFTFDRTE
ncbi:MAG: class IV adenylate cyclase [Candidatus Doudnabacteria bacterium]